MHSLKRTHIPYVHTVVKTRLRRAWRTVYHLNDATDEDTAVCVETVGVCMCMFIYVCVSVLCVYVYMCAHVYVCMFGCVRVCVRV